MVGHAFHKRKGKKDAEKMEHDIEKVFKENQIANFDIPKEYYDVICDAIKYHNKLNCPENLNEYNKLLERKKLIAPSKEDFLNEKLEKEDPLERTINFYMNQSEL